MDDKDLVLKLQSPEDEEENNENKKVIINWESNNNDDNRSIDEIVKDMGLDIKEL